MRYFVLFILLLVGISSCDPAYARDSIRPLYTESSAPGESLDRFAARIAARAVQESMSVSGEVCGEFRLVDHVYSVTFYTLGHLTACSYTREAQDGYTGISYHTHIFIGITQPDVLRQKLYSPRFSEADYAHPGYMTTGKVLLFHSGSRDSVRKVSIR